MNGHINRQRLLGSAALTLGGALAALSFAGSAQAQSVCTVNTVPSPDTYACTNGGGNGTITDLATVTATAQGLQVGNTAATTVTEAGTITTNNGQSAVYEQITGAGATYSSTGTTASTAPATFTTYVRGSTANATTNIINTTGSGSRALVTISDAGANTTTAGTTTVTGDNAYGIQATSNGGALIVNSGTVSLTGSTVAGGGYGVLSTSNGGTNTTTGTSTTINSNNAVGISASATGGTLIANTGTVIATGTNDVGVQTASTTGNNITTGTSTTVIGANTYGIQASSNGGTLQVNGGTVNATGAGAYGIAATSVGGTNTVNGGTTTVSGVNATGISATGNDGILIVNTGNVGATGVGAVGVRTSTIAGTGVCNTSTINVTGNVSGVASGVNADACGAGNVNVNAGKTVSASAGPAIINNATGVATTNVSGTVTAAAGLAAIDNNGTSSVTTLNSGAAVTGTFNGTVGNDTFTVANGATFTTAGTSDFGLGVDSLANAGTLTTTGATTFLGLETFGNTGTVNLAPALFSVPTSTSFTNGGTINATGGATMITSLAPVANSGTINLQDGVTGDFLTITNAYAGSGAAALNIDAAATTSDRLIVTGAASGSTRVNANILGGNLINIPGNLVVDTNTLANTFVLGNVTGNTSPLVNYALVQNGTDYFLTAAPTAAAFDPMAVGNLASSIWYQSADEVQNQTDLPAVTVGASVWGQAYYSHDRVGDRNDAVTLQGTTFTVDNRVKTRRMGIQGGVDYGFEGARVGVTGGYGEAKTRNDLSSRFKATGWNAGLYGQFGGPIGFHGSALVKHDSYKLRFTNGAFNGEHARLRADGVDGSLGYRFGMGGDTMLDAKVGLSHVRTKVGNIDAFGFTYDYGRIKSTRGRAGLRATFNAGSLAPYIDASIHHEFDGKRNLRLFDGTNSFDLDSTGKGTWGRIEAGLTGRDGPGPILALWADVGDKRGFGARAGFRFGGQAMAMAAPVIAPPPPPPAPVATQVCTDGSVILATDSCPLPPPAPEPVPAPVVQPGERG
ncbi:MAG: hypothetical protein ABIT69_07700 [Sphingomicrobium sp.]